MSDPKIGELTTRLKSAAFIKRPLNAFLHAVSYAASNAASGAVVPRP